MIDQARIAGRAGYVALKYCDIAKAAGLIDHQGDRARKKKEKLGPGKAQKTQGAFKPFVKVITKELFYKTSMHF